MKLFPHQEEALKLTETRNHVAYFYDMGLGKTFIGSEKLVQLDARINITICQKSKVNDWVEHFEEHYQNCVVYNLTNKKQYEQFWSDLKFAEENNEARFQLVAVINYELAWRRKELLKLKNFTLMLDESSLIQNRKAEQSKFILKLKPQNVILLSGTPCSGKYENLWTQVHLLGWNISEDLYNKHYVNRQLVEIAGAKFYQVNKENPYKNVERLKSKLHDNGCLFMKTDEVFDLPEQTYIDVRVDTSKEYKQFMKDSIITINDTELIGDTSLTKLLYARQLCGMYSQDKLRAFSELLESTSDRLIVFYNFDYEYELLRHACELIERAYSTINGKAHDLYAYENEIDSVTFCQYQAASMGLNLQKANKIIYFSPTLRCEHWMQSQKRIHRIGQNKSCFYYKMIVKNSVEEKIYEALERGVDYTDELFERM